MKPRPEIVKSDTDGVPSYTITDGDLSFYYNYSDSLLNAGEDSWHLISDKTRKVDGETMESRIKYGAIRIEISSDQLNRTQVDYVSNVFEDVPVSTESNLPIDVIAQFSSLDEYYFYRDSGLYTAMADGKLALIPDIDMDYISTLSDGTEVTNLVRMQMGYAPVDPAAGNSYQLHHINQNADGTPAVLTAEQHQTYSSILHTAEEGKNISASAWPATSVRSTILHIEPQHPDCSVLLNSCS